MNKRLGLKRAFRRIAQHCARIPHRAAAADLACDDWTGGLYEMRGLEVSVYRDGDGWILDILARTDGVLGEMSETELALLVDYERVLQAASAANTNNPAFAGIKLQLMAAAIEESGRLADELLALMEVS